MVDQDCVLFIFQCMIKYTVNLKRRIEKRKTWERKRSPVKDESAFRETLHGPIAQPVRAHA